MSLDGELFAVSNNPRNSTLIFGVTLLGGGTILPPQMAVLQMLGCAGKNVSNPCANATKLAEIIVAAVLAGELSLLAALNSGNLIKSHLKHNRWSLNIREASSNNIYSMESAIKYAEKSIKNTGLEARFYSILCDIWKHFCGSYGTK